LVGAAGARIELRGTFGLPSSSSPALDHHMADASAASTTKNMAALDRLRIDGEAV
jgi:hypothetical protein